MDTYVVRAEIIDGFHDLADQLGLDAEQLLASADLSTALVADRDRMLPNRAVMQLYHNASIASGREDFCLLLARRQRPLPIGIARLLVQHAGTVGQALELIAEHIHLHSEGILWELERGDNCAGLIREDRAAGRQSGFQYATLSLAHALIAVRYLIDDSHWSPERVDFSFAEIGQLQRFRNYFGCRVAFNQERTRILFPVALLERQLSYREPQLQALARRHLQKLPQVDKPLLQRVEILIRSQLHKQNCQLDNLAASLELHPKTLQRHLAREGWSFRRLKAHIRLDMAEHYLKDSNLSLTTLADILGFSELSGLSRAFRERHGMAPQQWRLQHRQELLRR